MASRFTRRPDMPPADQSTDPADPAGNMTKPDRLAARRQREAAALRANLRRRKDQARAREKPSQE